MSVPEISRRELGEALIEIVEAYYRIAIRFMFLPRARLVKVKEESAGLNGTGAYSIFAMKKCLNRFGDIYRVEYRLAGSEIRVRVKGRMYVGYILSTDEAFPESEALWRFLHSYRVKTANPYLLDYPKEKTRLLKWEQKCTEEVNSTILLRPIDQSTDYRRILWSFETMVHLAHLGPDFNPINPNHRDWRQADPWQLPRGESMLIDYFYNVPMSLRPFAHSVIDRLADSSIQSTRDLLDLRRNIEEWMDEDQ